MIDDPSVKDSWCPRRKDSDIPDTSRVLYSAFVETF